MLLVWAQAKVLVCIVFDNLGAQIIWTPLCYPHGKSILMTYLNIRWESWGRVCSDLCILLNSCQVLVDYLNSVGDAILADT